MPHLTALQKEVLAHMQSHPGSSTSGIAIAMGKPLKTMRRTLFSLAEVKLVGRQSSLLPGEYESRWTAELVAATPSSRAR